MIQTIPFVNQEKAHKHTHEMNTRPFFFATPRNPHTYMLENYDTRLEIGSDRARVCLAFSAVDVAEVPT